MIRLEMKNDMILTKKQQKYLLHHLEKLVNMNILQANKYCAKFEYSPLRKAFKKQTKTIEEQGKKQIKATKNRVKKFFLDTSKTNCFFVFKRFFK